MSAIDDLDWSPFDHGAIDHDPSWVPAEVWTENFARALPKASRWRDRFGTEHELKHLGTEHLVNIAAFLWRHGLTAKLRGLDAEVISLIRIKLREVLDELRKRLP